MISRPCAARNAFAKRWAENERCRLRYAAGITEDFVQSTISTFTLKLRVQCCVALIEG